MTEPVITTNLFSKNENQKEDVEEECRRRKENNPGIEKCWIEEDDENWILKTQWKSRD